jgi:hypothetical protein
VTRDQAVQLIQGLCKALDPDGTPSKVGLNENDLGGVSIGEEALYFEYQKAKGELTVSALVYRFRAKPKAPVLEAFRALEKQEDKGGGRFDYQAASKSVLLSRTYESAGAAALKADVEKLVAACQRWRRDVIPSVAERANRGRNLK